MTVGQGPRVEGGGLKPRLSLRPKSNIASIEFKLLSAQERQISTEEIVQAWRDEVGVLPYVRGIVFSGELIDFGSPIEGVVLSHPNPERLGQIADSVVNGLRGIGGVYDVRADHTPGIREIQLELRPEARTLGLTLEDMAQQTRAAFFGAEALRVQRGREEVRVYVRLPADERNAITDIEGYLIRTPSGAEVPLSQVAQLHSGTSPPTVRRKDGQQVVTVTADVDDTVISGNEANRILADSILAELGRHRPRPDVYIRWRTTTANRISGRALSRFRYCTVYDFRLVGHPSSLLYQTVHYHGRRPARDRRRDHGSLDPGNRHECHIFHGRSWSQRRCRKRLFGHDGLYRSATSRGRLGRNRDH